MRKERESGRIRHVAVLGRSCDRCVCVWTCVSLCARQGAWGEKAPRAKMASKGSAKRVDQSAYLLRPLSLSSSLFLSPSSTNTCRRVHTVSADQAAQWLRRSGERSPPRSTGKSVDSDNEIAARDALEPHKRLSAGRGAPSLMAAVRHTSTRARTYTWTQRERETSEGNERAEETAVTFLLRRCSPKSHAVHAVVV